MSRHGFCDCPKDGIDNGNARETPASSNIDRDIFPTLAVRRTRAGSFRFAAWQRCCRRCRCWRFRKPMFQDGRRALSGKTSTLWYRPGKKCNIAGNLQRGSFRPIQEDHDRSDQDAFHELVLEITRSRAADENAKTGDDFAARIYVVSEKGIMGMNSLSINYVWASKHSAGSHWTSPFTKQVRLVAVNSGSNGLNTWVSHKQGIRSDLRELFGGTPTSIDAVALMTGTDNSGQRATAYYGDIWFGARNRGHRE